MASPDPKSLTVVIPALDEEQSIVSIIERTLAARDAIAKRTGVTKVNVVVVSDGSTDRTVERARAFEPAIDLVVFEKNRGYGAAIMAGWAHRDADLVGFLDADGTCDPLFFADLIGELDRRDADIALGCRLNPDSQMPLVRWFGNTLFAGLMSMFSMSRIRDTASGMRVVRRSSLPQIMPLPDGLHFTPAMSARGILARDLTVAEIDMPYREREGESKLNPVKDGVRFLAIIIETAFLHRPARPLNIASLLLMLVVLGMMVYPAIYYLQHGELQSWMIYRFLVGQLLATSAVLLACVGFLCNKASDTALADDPIQHRYHGTMGWVVSRRWFLAIPATLMLLGVAFVAEALVHYVTTGEVYEHWSRFVVMTTLWLSAIILTVTKLMDWSLNLLAARLSFVKRTRDDNVSAARVGSSLVEHQVEA